MLVWLLTNMLTTKATRSNQYLTELPSIHPNEKNVLNISKLHNVKFTMFRNLYVFLRE